MRLGKKLVNPIQLAIGVLEQSQDMEKIIPCANIQIAINLLVDVSTRSLLELQIRFDYLIILVNLKILGTKY